MDSASKQSPERHARLVISARPASSGANGHEHRWNLPQGGWPSVLESSIQEVFEVMLGTSVVRQPASRPIEGTSLTAMVGLAGDLCGVLSLRCRTDTACRLVGKMLGEDPAQFDETAMDALAEICNMVAGTVKSKVPGLEDRCLLSTPTVITGREYRLHSVADGARSEVMLDFEGDPITVALDLHS
jgi:chemotaxis protein CheX